jgi:hypothetical protein
MESSEKDKKSNAGNLYLMFLGLLLVIMGSLFMYLMWTSFQRANLTRSKWLEIPCVILESKTQQLEQRPNYHPEFRWEGKYRYTFKDVDYIGTQLELRGSKSTSKQEMVDKVVEKFPLGAVVPCFVDPNNPSAAILKHDSRGSGYSIWFPGLFAVGGIGMIVGAARKWNT